MSSETTKLDCPYGFNGTQEQLLRALRHIASRDSASSRHVKDTAAWLIERQAERITRLEAALMVVVGTSCDDPSSDETPTERLWRVSDLARVTLDIPL